MTQPQTHETLSRDEKLSAGSDRSFGFVFAAVFTVIGLFPLLGDTPHVSDWPLVIAGVFLLLALVYPKILAPLNQLWFKFGLLLHKIVNPIIMGLIFFTTITPMAIGLRLLGKDPLKRKFDTDAKSYWIIRDPAGPKPDSMRNQF